MLSWENAPFRYSHSIVDIQASVNSKRSLNCAFIYSRQRITIPKPELSWNSTLSSTSARERAGMVIGYREVNPWPRKREPIAHN